MKQAAIALKILCGIILAVIAVRLLAYHYNLLIHPFPHEYREGAMMTTTDALVRGINPFALRNQPQYMNDYGILYSLVVFPFAKIFGATLLVHRIVTGFFILACCGLMAWVMRRLKVDILLNAVAVTFFYAVALYPSTTTPLVNPSSLGLFIFLMALFIPWAKGFSFSSLCISAVLGVLGFYTKPYFLLSVPILAVYLFFFVSRRKSIGFFAVFSLLAFVSVLYVHRQWDCYFANCFFLHMNPGHLSWAHSIRQFKAFVLLNWAVLAASLIVLSVQLYQAFRDRLSLWRALRSLSFILYCTILCSLALFCWLGKHEEAYLWYYFHLLSPLLLIGMAVTLNRQLPWTLVLVPFILWNCWIVSMKHQDIKLDPGDENWRKVEELIATHKDILNSPLIAPLLVQHHRPVYDNGLSEYFKKGGYRETALIRLFSKGDPRIILRYYAFLNEMKDKIRRREFDLVMIVFDYSPLVPGELKEYYRPLGSLRLNTPAIYGSWLLTFWVPNDR